MPAAYALARMRTSLVAAGLGATAPMMCERRVASARARAEGGVLERGSGGHDPIARSWRDGVIGPGAQDAGHGGDRHTRVARYLDDPGQLFSQRLSENVFVSFSSLDPPCETVNHDLAS